ncbi:MAG: HU family DNA-binding protein [Prevotellaceae bacterium]|jgi:DNA-binding protein HU-beta|nr:HU family DNA-binding protein [Prevotellaceae bacterium]
MNNKEFQNALTVKTGLKASEVDNLLHATLETLLEQIKAEKTVSMQGFGSFELRRKAEREMVNPMTKVRTVVPAKFVLAFQTSSVYKEKLKDLPRYE